MEENELPDEAAIREVWEETGIGVELLGERREDVTDPVQLHRPAGVQLENIAPGHQHIDLLRGKSTSRAGAGDSPLPPSTRHRRCCSRPSRDTGLRARSCACGRCLRT